MTGLPVGVKTVLWAAAIAIGLGAAVELPDSEIPPVGLPYKEDEKLNELLPPLVGAPMRFGFPP